MLVGQKKSVSNFTKSEKKALVEKIEKRVKKIFYHEDFDKPLMAKSILAPMPGLDLYMKESRKIKASFENSSTMGHTRVCYEDALLSREQEYHLFRQYNFRKYRAKIRLEKREFSEALRELKAADAVRKSLASANVRLAMPIVKKYSQNRLFEDIVSESYCFILKAIDCFDFNRGFKFSTYGTWVIIRNMQRIVRQFRQYDARYQTGYDKCDFGKVSGVSEFEEKFESVQNKELVDTILNYCSPRERSVLKKRFFQEKTLKEIGEEMGLSKERIRQIERDAFKSIVSRLQKSGVAIHELW